MDKKQFCIRKRTNSREDSRFTSFTKKADIYGETVNFQISGNSSHGTICGSIITAMLSTILIGYTVIWSLVYIHRDDTTHLEYTKFNGLPRDKVYTYEEIGFNASLIFFPKVWTSFDLAKYPNVDEYVTLKAYQYNIQTTSQNKVEAAETELKTRRCTLDDFDHSLEFEQIQIASLTYSTCLDNPRDYVLQGAA